MDYTRAADNLRSAVADAIVQGLSREDIDRIVERVAHDIEEDD